MALRGSLYPRLAQPGSAPALGAGGRTFKSCISDHYYRPIPYRDMQHSLELWLSQFDSVHVIADWPEDIQHFCNALIIGAGMRINTPPLTMEVLRIDAESTLPHNALHDARGIRDAVCGSL